MKANNWHYSLYTECRIINKGVTGWLVQCFTLTSAQRMLSMRLQKYRNISCISHTLQVMSTKFIRSLTVLCVEAKLRDTLIYTLKIYTWHLHILSVPACTAHLQNVVGPIKVSPRADHGSVFRADTGCRGVETSHSMLWKPTPMLLMPQWCVGNGSVAELGAH